MSPLIGMGWAVLIIERRADAIAIIIGLSLLYLLIVFGLYKHSKNEKYYLTVKENDMDICYPKGISNDGIGNVAYRDIVRIEYYRVSSVRAWLKVFLDYVSNFEYCKLGIQKPDIVVFLTAPFDMVTKMRNGRVQNDGIKNDLHERDIEYMREVYDNAMFVANHLSWDIVECNDGYKLRSREDIHNEIYHLVRKKTK